MLDLIESDLEGVDENRPYEWEDVVDTQHNVSRFTRSMWIALLILALFNSAQLVTVVNGFGVGPVQDAAVALAGTWNDQMKKNNLDAPVAEIRGGVEALKNMSWSAFSDFTIQRRHVQDLHGPIDETSG